MTRHDPLSRSAAPCVSSPQLAFSTLAEAARDREPVTGSTHNFYRYPARFSPRFAAAVIEHFSRPGDLIVDPYMGGGTAIVEGILAGRQMVGNDLNSLAAFITKVKITKLTHVEDDAILAWSREDVPNLSYRLPSGDLAAVLDESRTKNLSLTRARFIKKAIAAALASISRLPTQNAQNFARCAVLRVAQWALDGREQHTPLKDFRQRLGRSTAEMLCRIRGLSERVQQAGGRATLLNIDAAVINEARFFREGRERAALVVTSPPYPGVHVLYHRWQVDGRRETPAPYWISGCNDGQGASFYTFGNRRHRAATAYFRKSLLTLQAIRRIMRDGGYMVQMIAFSQPDEHLERYLDNMRLAGFAEVSTNEDERIWRQVPNRKWHARQRGVTHAANEVVLVHRAV